MSEIQTTSRTAVQIAKEALGDSIDGANWGGEGPQAFDDAVFYAADRVRQTLSLAEEELLIAHVGDNVLYYRTLEALRGWPGGRNYATARLIVATYWEMEIMGL